MLLRETTDGCTVLAPAKLNLCLEVLGRLENGYHEVRTLICPLRWYDTLRLTARKNDKRANGNNGSCVDFHLIDPHGTAPSGQENLVVVALRTLAQRTSADLASLRVELVKRVPSQAGLGGGSSDAAAALVAANHVCRLGLSQPELQEIGASLGSDIPYFIHAILARGGSSARDSRAAVCSGRGERVEGVPSVGGVPCVVVKPEFGLSTASVYRECSHEDMATANCDARSAADWLAKGCWRSDPRDSSAMGNALQAAAARIAPAIDRVRRLMEGLPVFAHQLSGSGSAYFALCASFREAKRVAAVVRSHGLGAVYATSTC